MLAYCILHYALSSLMARRENISDKVNNFRNASLAKYSPTENIAVQISRRQVIHLDLLSSIFMFMEDFLGFSHNLRGPLSTFPKSIASKNYHTVEKEISFLKRCNKNDIKRMLLFPDITKFTIEGYEKKLVSKHLQNIANDTYLSLKNILRFYRRFYRVYIKYKHIFAAILGTGRERLDFANKNIVYSSQIFIRDYNEGFSTYIIPTTSIDSVDYYEDIIDAIYTVFLNLIIAHLSSLNNLGDPFIIPVYPKGVSSSEKLQEIVRKVNHYPNPFVPIQTEISFTENLSNRIISKMQKEKIFKLRSDIFNYRQRVKQK